jgi:hypothetical protein
MPSPISHVSPSNARTPFSDPAFWVICLYLHPDGVSWNIEVSATSFISLNFKFSLLFVT